VNVKTHISNKEKFQMNSRFWFFIIGLIFVISSGLVVNQSEAQTGGCSTTHTIQRGETLFRIAVRYKTTVADLQARNSISNPNRIYAGQQLCISGGFVPPMTPIPGNQVGLGTVSTWALNVRYGAGIQYPIIRQIVRGETFPTLGRSSDGLWYQITVDAIAGTKGWVSSTYFTVANPHNLPIVSGETAPYSANMTGREADAFAARRRHQQRIGTDAGHLRRNRSGGGAGF
jgi:LysM repeat protein